jgi:hypothetical protein
MKGSSTRKAPGEKARLLKKFARRLFDTPVPQRREEGMLIRQEMLDGMDTNSLETQKNYIRDLRKAIKKEHPDVDQADLPGFPRELVKAVKAKAAENVAMRTNDKIIIDADMMIPLLVKGMKDAKERGQVPQALFCASYLIALRPNDLNTQKKRDDGSTSRPEDYECVKGVLVGDDDLEVVGTYNNLKPSKETTTGKRFIDKYATVLICDECDYDTVASTISWAMNDEFASLPCTTTVPQYKRGVASGAEVKGQEWRTNGGGITSSMVARLGLEDAIVSWGFNEGVGFTKQLGRSFVASCIEQGRVEFGTGLTSSQAVELVLGHAPGSTNNNDYLKFDCQSPTPVEGVVAMKVCKERSIDDVEYGLCLVKK